PAALGAELRAPEDRCAAFAARRRARAAEGHGGGEQGVELGQPLLELLELDAPVDEQVLPELVTPVHLEHEPTEVPQLLLPDDEEQPPLAAELAGRRQRAPDRTARGRRCGCLIGRRPAAK